MKRIFAVVFVLIVLAAFTPLCCFAVAENLTCGDFQLSDTCSSTENSITFTGSVIIDLSGRSLTAQAIRCSGDSCSLTITDTTGTGVLDSVIFINGDISISGGTVRAAGTTDEATGNQYGIYADGDINISGGTVRAASTTDEATGNQYGIYADGDINISGGTVHATAAEEEDEQMIGKLYGIYAGHNITISGENTQVTAEATDEDGFGIYAGGDINISGGTVEATGGAYGIYSLPEGSSVTISGGTVEATGIGLDGIISRTVAISGGKVTATGAIGIGGHVINISDGEVTATGRYSAIHVEYSTKDSDIDIDIPVSISISGGTVEATGGIRADVNGTGIVRTVGDITISGGTVHAKAGISVSVSSNVSSSITGGDITISGGTVEVTEDDYIYIDDDIYSNIGDVAISGGEVTVNNVDIKAGKDITISGGQVSVDGDISASKNIYLGLAGPDDFIHAREYTGTIQATTPLRVFDAKEMTGEPLGTIQAGDTVNADTINSKWLGPLKFTVTLDQTDATTAGTQSVTATYGSPMPDITIPARTGYTFGGYFTETNGGGTQYYNADGSSAKKWTETEVDTLYALWEKIPPKPLSDPSVTARLIPGSSFPYTGEPCRVGAEVRDGDKLLTEGVDYEITADSVLSAVEVGTYEVTVSADEKAAAETEGKAAKAVTGGDYTGSVTLTWRITPGDTPERPGIDFFRLHADCELPATGFSSLRPAVLPEQPKDLRYEPARMHLMLPTLDREIELVTMPREGNSWAAAWLGADAGILEGSALPGEGVSIIAAHNTLNDTDYGPFALLSTLEVNDTVMVREESGALKLFRVYANELLAPDDMERLSALAGDDALVLLTCENESPAGTYLHRRAIFAR